MVPEALVRYACEGGSSTRTGAPRPKPPSLARPEPTHTPEWIYRTGKTGGRRVNGRWMEKRKMKKTVKVRERWKERKKEELEWVGW